MAHFPYWGHCGMSLEKLERVRPRGWMHFFFFFYHRRHCFARPGVGVGCSASRTLYVPLRRVEGSRRQQTVRAALLRAQPAARSPGLPALAGGWSGPPHPQVNCHRIGETASHSSGAGQSADGTQNFAFVWHVSAVPAPNDQLQKLSCPKYEFKVELPWVVFLAAVRDCPSALCRAERVLFSCTARPALWDLSRWKRSEEADPFSPEKTRACHSSKGSFVSSLGENVLRQLWCLFLLIYYYLNTLVAPCLLTACFALSPSRLLRTFGKCKWCQPGRGAKAGPLLFQGGKGELKCLGWALKG